ncbi:MAG: hypothetical protein K2M86_03585, partial [Odoribacter sp.]|nr:hypothetical protein [Odoribacter sp.]
AIRDGKAEGSAEGRAEGRIEGRAEGIAEGEYKAQQRIAANLKKSGLSIQEIAALTGLTPEEIALL